jgi:hypothetical protein
MSTAKFMIVEGFFNTKIMDNKRETTQIHSQRIKKTYYNSKKIENYKAHNANNHYDP